MAVVTTLSGAVVTAVAVAVVAAVAVAVIAAMTRVAIAAVAGRNADTVLAVIPVARRALRCGGRRRR